jgi:hypothetical protein
MAALHPADWVILGVIAISLALGFFRGFVREAFSVAGWMAAYVVARLFHAPLEQLLVDSISTPSLRLAVAWGGLFVTTLMLAALASYLILERNRERRVAWRGPFSGRRLRSGPGLAAGAGGSGDGVTFCQS